MSLPGAPYDLNIDTTWAWFSRNEFSVSFSDTGTLKQVTLNSDPQIDETIQSTATLVKELGAVAALGLKPLGAEPCPTKDVVTEEQVMCMLPIAQWRENHYKCQQ
jgi:hypothetical protein